MAKNTQVQKTLTMANINKEIKTIEEQKTIQVTSKVSGEVYTLKIDKHYKDSKVLELIAEIMAQVQNARINKIDLNAIFIPYSVFLILKYFSSLGKDIPTELNQQVAFLMKLIDIGLIESIFNQLPQDELDKIFDQINKAVEGMGKDLDSVYDELQKMQDIMDEGEIE